MKYWNLFDHLEEREKAEVLDGHTANDVCQTMLNNGYSGSYSYELNVEKYGLCGNDSEQKKKILVGLLDN